MIKIKSTLIFVFFLIFLSSFISADMVNPGTKYLQISNIITNFNDFPDYILLSSCKMGSSFNLEVINVNNPPIVSHPTEDFVIQTDTMFYYTFPSNNIIDIDENASSIIRFCNKIGIPYCCRYSSNSTIKKYAFSQNKIGITLELNGMNNIDYQSAFEYGSRYIYNILSKIDLLIKFKQTLDQVNIKPYVSQICNHEGIFEQNYINGDLIKENQTFGQIYDLDGSVVEECLTTSSGRFLGGGNKGGYVKVGDEIGIIQPEIKY